MDINEVIEIIKQRSLRNKYFIVVHNIYLNKYQLIFEKYMLSAAVKKYLKELGFVKKPNFYEVEKNTNAVLKINKLIIYFEKGEK